MRLLVGLRGTWKCIQVHLEEGCRPAIGGNALEDCKLEPALWFKVRSERCCTYGGQRAEPTASERTATVVASRVALPMTSPSPSTLLAVQTMVLESVCVDCSQRVISWRVAGPPRSRAEGEEEEKEEGDSLLTDQAVYRPTAVSTAAEGEH